MKNLTPENARFIDVSRSVDFNYQYVGLYAGLYVPNVKDYRILNAAANGLYFIKEMSVSGGIPEEQFIQSSDADNLCTCQLKRICNGEMVSAQKHVISQYYKDKSMQSYFVSNRNNDGILLSIEGVLKQIPETIGFEKITLVFTIAIYQINDDGLKREILKGKV